MKNDFIKRAKAFDRELEALEKKYCVSLGAGYSVPHDEENYLMLSDWKDKGETFIKLYELDDWEEEDDETDR